MISLVPATATNPFEEVEELVRKVANPTRSQQDRIFTAINRGFADNFDNQQAGDEAEWMPLRPQTIRQRRKRGYGPTPILEQSGKYKRTFTNRGAPGHVERFSNTGRGFQAESGSQDERTGVLEFGGWNAGGRYVPPRPASFLGARAEDRVFDTLDDITEEIMGA